MLVLVFWVKSARNGSVDRKNGNGKEKVKVGRGEKGEVEGCGRKCQKIRNVGD